MKSGVCTRYCGVDPSVITVSGNQFYIKVQRCIEGGTFFISVCRDYAAKWVDVVTQSPHEILIKLDLPTVPWPDIIRCYLVLFRSAFIVDHEILSGILIFPDIINSAKQCKVGGFVVNPGSLEILSPLVQILVLDG